MARPFLNLRGQLPCQISSLAHLTLAAAMRGHGTALAAGGGGFDSDPVVLADDRPPVGVVTSPSTPWPAARRVLARGDLGLPPSLHRGKPIVGRLALPRLVGLQHACDP